MVTTPQQKNRTEKDMAACLSGAREVHRVVVFGSFLTGSTSYDLDVAIFQDSGESYLLSAMKYRRLLRPIADQVPLDVIPVRPRGAHGQFLAEIETGDAVCMR